jgi:transglutaminase-like putative cysteine protease
MPCEFDPMRARLTVRVGCSLAYDCPQPVPLVLNLQPRRDPAQLLEAESLVLGAGLPAEEFEDAQGNIIYRLVLPAGRTEIRHDALVGIRPTRDNDGFGDAERVSPAHLPAELLRLTLPSRYCDSDKLIAFAWEKFGALPGGRAQVEAVCDWIHEHIDYRFGTGSPELSAWDVFRRGYGVCRDFAHLMIALCRALNYPARYVVGHLPDIGYSDPGSPMDFHAYCEVYLGGRWYVYDARYRIPRIGRIKISSGADAVDCAFATAYGPARLADFKVWAYQVAPGTVKLGDPIDLSLRLDGTPQIRGIPRRPRAAPARRPARLSRKRGRRSPRTSARAA